MPTREYPKLQSTITFNPNNHFPFHSKSQADSFIHQQQIKIAKRDALITKLRRKLCDNRLNQLYQQFPQLQTEVTATDFVYYIDQLINQHAENSSPETQIEAQKERKESNHQ